MMIVPVTNWLARRRSKEPAKAFIALTANLYGRKARISYNDEGYWSHSYDGWIVNDAYPDVRMNIDKLRSLIVDVYFHEYTPSPGDTCIDIGAGIGTETIYLSKKLGSKGKLFAIEAAPLTYQLLNANIRDNHLGNVRSFNYAISDHPGTVRISAESENHVKNSIFSGQGEAVEAVTMDGFIEQQGIGRINFLKANIEGAEKLLIRQFSHIRNVHHVAIACHDFLFRRTKNDFYVSRKAVTSFLERNNFEISSRNTGVDYKDDWIYAYNKSWRSEA